MGLCMKLLTLTQSILCTDKYNTVNNHFVVTVLFIDVYHRSAEVCLFAKHVHVHRAEIVFLVM